MFGLTGHKSSYLALNFKFIIHFNPFMRIPVIYCLKRRFSLAGFKLLKAIAMRTKNTKKRCIGVRLKL